MKTEINSPILQKNQSSFLKGIAIVGIMYYHFAYLSPENEYFLFKLVRFVFEQGFVGVNIFIFLSLYGLCKSFEKKRLLDFYYHRVKKIYPVFIIWGLASFFYKGNSILEVLASFTGFSLFWDIDHYAWYLEASVILYLCFPLLYYFAKYTIHYSYLVTIALIGLTFYLSNNPVCNNYQANIFLNLFPTIFAGLYTHFYERKDMHEALAYLGVIAIFSFMPNARHSFLMLPALCCVISQKVIPIVCIIGKYSLEIYAAHSIVLFFFINLTSNFYIDFLLFTIATGVMSIILRLITQSSFLRKQIEEK